MSDKGLTEPSDHKGARRSAVREGIRPLTFIKCLVLRRGHDFVNSKSKPGNLTCVRCRYRRPINM